MSGILLNIRRKLAEIICITTSLMWICMPAPLFAASVLGLNNNLTDIPTLDVFDPNLSPLASVDLGMSGRAHRLITVDEFFADKNRNGRVDTGEILDLAFVSGRKSCAASPATNPCGEIVIIDVTSVEAPVVIGSIPMPGIIRELDIDADRKWLYAGGDSGTIPGGGSAFYVVDISNPFVRGLVDVNSDGKDDRIIWTEPFIPSSDGEVTAMRVDTDRQLIYIGTSKDPTQGSFDVFGFTPPNMACVGGRITYSRYQTNPALGLDYSSKDKMPARNIVVELKDQYNSVLATKNTTDEGTYSFSVLIPHDTVPLTVTVKSQLGDAQHPHVTVVDNTNSDALYEYSFSTTGKRGVCTNKDHNLDAEWSNPAPVSPPVFGAHYIGTREAAPFAILDTIYEVMQFVKKNAQDPGLSFPPIKVKWSQDNSDGAHYAGSDTDINDNLIYLNGTEDDDTDEYDRHVIAHEWGHYFQKRFSREDSIAGTHYGSSLLDPRVAFSEGWATAFAGMALNDPVYVDSAGPQQGNGNACSDCVNQNIEKDTDSADRVWYLPGLAGFQEEIRMDGFYSENSVQEVIWDIFDSDDCPACNPARVSDDDVLNTGMSFKWIYDAMKEQKTTPAFVTIFSFLHSLKSVVPPVALNDITDIAGRENIGDSDEFGDPFTNPIIIYTPPQFPPHAPGLYSWIPQDGSQMTTEDIEINEDIDGRKLSTYYQFSHSSNPGDSRNKLLQYRFIRFNMAVAGNIQIEVTPESVYDQASLKVFKKGELIGDAVSPGTGEKAVLSLAQSQLESNIDYVIEAGSATPSDDVQFGVRICPNTCW